MKVLKDTVAVAYVHPNTVMEGFARSLANACLNPANKILAVISTSNPRQENARNAAIERFLEGTTVDGKPHGAEWLMWLDTDQTFEHDAIARLRKTAHDTKAKLVGGLTFVYKRQDNILLPNGWTWDSEIGHWRDIDDYVSGKKYEIQGTGAAFLLIHRDVFNWWNEYTEDKNLWHRSGVHPDTGNYMGHDLAFCYDTVVKGPFKLFWDTSVQSGHIKHFELDENMFRNYQKGQQ